MKRIFDHIRDHLWLKCLGHDELANATCLRYPSKLVENCVVRFGLDLLAQDMELYEMLGLPPPVQEDEATSKKRFEEKQELFGTRYGGTIPKRNQVALPHIQGLPDTDNEFFAEDIRDAVNATNLQQRRKEAEKEFARTKRAALKAELKELTKDWETFTPEFIETLDAAVNATNLQKGIDAGLVIVPPKRGRGRPSKAEIAARKQAELADDDSWL